MALRRTGSKIRSYVGSVSPKKSLLLSSEPTPNGMEHIQQQTSLFLLDSQERLATWATLLLGQLGSLQQAGAPLK